MAGHKCVQFRAGGVKKSGGCHKLREPDGMANVDLRNDAHEVDAEIALMKTAWTKTFQKFLVKGLLVAMFLTCSMITFIALLPPPTIKTGSTEPLSKNNTAAQRYLNDFYRCINIKSLEECCMLIPNNATIENCREEESSNEVENINESSDQYSIENSEITETEEANESILNFKVKIMRLDKPIIKNHDVFFDTENTSIHIQAKPHHNFLVKRSESRQSIGTNPDLYYDEANESFGVEYEEDDNNQIIQRKTYPGSNPRVNRHEAFNIMENGFSEERIYYDNVPIYEEDFDNTKTRNNEEVNSILGSQKIHMPPNTKQLNLHSNQQTQPPNRSKHTQFDSTSNDVGQSNLLNLKDYHELCSLYSTKIKASIPGLQYSNPYPPSFLPMLGVPENTNMNSQYPYLHLVYPSPVLPNVYPMYPYNPFYWNQKAQTPSSRHYLCSQMPASRTASSSLSSEQPSAASEESIEEFNNQTRISRKCMLGEVQCVDGNRCIKQSQVCDFQVDCLDASDEIFCSCKERLGEDRLCDGYLDCPNGEDEMECFGCGLDSFICDSSISEDKSAVCVSREQRCDGIPQCLNGRDEEDCSVLSEFYENSLPAQQVSMAKGFLYRNYKGIWYPTCSDPQDWAEEICDKETGKNEFSPLFYMVPVKSNYRGPYLNKLLGNQVEIVNVCLDGYAMYVECPPPTCGIRSVSNTSLNSEEADESMEDAISRFRHERSSNENDADILELSRVVGGNPSKPAAWPWVVSVYRNGYFHCGGVILNEDWVVTAAHCIDRYTHYHYEVEAGILRRFSYSPMQQTRTVAQVIAHNNYDRAHLKNDLALMRLSKPLTYSRYVRPICLPDQSIIGKNHLKEPLPGTLCTAVGWGATVEHGIDPDHLREVEIPVLSRCKDGEDGDGVEICAGYHQGGRDACQGDSGGPFMCKNPSFPQQWYLAGIVSHGEGCARPDEPGVYTRVGVYLDWIHKHLNHFHEPTKTPLRKCPGYVCKWSRKCLPKKKRCDRIADCLLGDDEVHCEKSMSAFLKEAVRHMMLAERRHEAEEEKVGTPKSETEVTSATTTESTALITGEIPVTTTAEDSIFRTAFKMENSPRDLNGNEFDYTEHDTSFASSLLPDEDYYVSYDTTSEDTKDIYTEVTQIAENATYQQSTESTTEIVSSPSTFIPHQISVITSSTPVTSASKERNGTTPKTDHFKCTRMLQIVPLTKRCNKVADCEDVSDEENCSCAEYLQNLHPEAICDGYIHCHDLTDETNCEMLCSEDEHRCVKSKMCVPLIKRCDGVSDCPYNEDEQDCFTLAEDSTIHLDVDSRPLLNLKGVVAFYSRGLWWPLCGSDWTKSGSEVASEVCVSLGFLEYERYFEMEVINRPFKTIPSVDVRIEGNDVDIEWNGDDPEKCKVLYVKCFNVTAIRRLKAATAAPWDAAIYVDGIYKCTGALLQLNWALTSYNCFRGVGELNLHYVAVLLGIGDGYLDVVGPHEQIGLVAESMPVLYSDVFLLRFERNVDCTRHVRPLNFPMHNVIHRYKDICYATGRSEADKLISVELIKLPHCVSSSKCFKRTQPVTSECHITEKHWSGTIICDSGNGFYPSAVFYEENGACGFQRAKPFTTVSLFAKTISDLFERSDISIVHRQECGGFRCTLGKCIESRRICDGIPDCRAGEDEDASMCQERNVYCHLSNRCDCAKHQLTCGNGKCIPKSAFCNKINDCEDGSDEPDICNCFAYLMMTNPDKICDGVRNCYDRSDERPEICKCDVGRFMCAQSKLCIPMEMVCDGHRDCANGEDEEQCIKFITRNNNFNAGEVLMRTAGVWHQGCFDENLTEEELHDICRRLGFSSNNGTELPYLSVNDRIAKKPTFDLFNTVWLNNKSDVRFKLALRSGDKPYISFSNSTDCYRLFVDCI